MHKLIYRLLINHKLLYVINHITISILNKKIIPHNYLSYCSKLLNKLFHFILIDSMIKLKKNTIINKCNNNLTNKISR